MKKRKWTTMTAIMVGIVLLTGCGEQEGKKMEEIAVKNQVMGVSVHDPSIVKADGKYYIFGSHMEAAVSEDLQSFKTFASGVNAKNPLFDNLFDEKLEAFDYVGTFENGKDYAVWAPEVIYNKAMGKWVMYFSTSHDYRTSAIHFATADSVEGPYHYTDTLLYSGFTSKTVEKTNFFEIMGEDARVSEYLQAAQYNNLNYPNCIDPTVFYDADGRMWMIYGSWSGGIFMLELDEQTGYPIHPAKDEEKKIDPYFGQYLMGGLHNSCEGPYLLYDEASGYYFLFVSYGELTREGGYQIRLYRSKEVTGPYLDAAGNTFGYLAEHSGVGLKMMGNYKFPSLKKAYMAPGHNSAMIDEDGRYYLVYHQRFEGDTEYHEPRVHQMFLNEAGWLVAAPFAVSGENAEVESHSDVKEIAGTWYLLNHGTDISATIHSAEAATLKKDGTLLLKDGTKGTCIISAGTGYVTISLNGATYKGVVGTMNDEAGNPVRFLSAAGDNNETIWAVFYLE
ncbi:MAG: glycoside hydrolase family 43 protein [Lachnospiraceae bacterium]|nr:glycoside hydrolase family 43 protein [Lachnospiraceae bacterium]